MAEIRFELDMDLHQRFKVACVQEHETMVGVVRDLIEDWVSEKEYEHTHPESKGLVP